MNLFDAALSKKGDKYVATILGRDFELPEAKQTTSAKYDIGMKYLSEALKKEKECDAKMQDVETRIRDLLTQLGESTSLADEIHAAYTEKKATLKAYYLGLH